MKVLWFTNTPSLAASHLNLRTFGGGWIEALEEEMKQNDEVDLAVAFNYGEGKIDKFTNEGTTYYTIPDTRKKIDKLTDRYFNLLSNGPLLEHCLEIINDFQPDIINIFGTEKGFGLISEKINIPVVIHLQGILTAYEKKWFSSGINKWDLIHYSPIRRLLKANSLIHDYYYFKKTAERERQILKISKHIMGRTDWDRRISAVLAPDAKYYVCNEIVRKGFYLTVWGKKPEKAKVFVSTIQANVYKGLETVLECAAILKKGNKFDFTWFVAGISEKEAIVKIFEKITGEELNGLNIVLTGKIGSEELIDIELGADIFIHPSHIDNSPNSVCEAMLLGMPIIATNTGGTGSLLTDRKEGILIPAGDPHSMAGAILELIRDPRSAAELGKNARLRALQRHDPDEIVTNLVDIYSGIIADTTATAAPTAKIRKINNA